jgi:hypothetical protein
MKLFVIVVVVVVVAVEVELEPVELEQQYFDDVVYALLDNRNTSKLL